MMWRLLPTALRWSANCASSQVKWRESSKKKKRKIHKNKLINVTQTHTPKLIINNYQALTPLPSYKYTLISGFNLQIQ